MFGFATLRWKILLALVGMSVIPLTVTLFLVSGLAEKKFDKDINSRIETVAQFVDRTTDNARREDANYIQLLASNADLVNATFYASLTGDAAQLQESVERAHQLFNFDLIEILNKDGSLMLRSLPEHDFPATSDKSHPLIEKGLAGENVSKVSSFDDQLSIIAISPLVLQDETIGLLIGVSLLDKKFAQQVKEVSGAEIAFYNKKGVFAATQDDLLQVDAALVSSGEEKEYLLDGVSHAVFTKNMGAANQGILIAVDRSEVVNARKYVKQILLIILLTAGGIAAVVGLAISRGIVRPLANVVTNLRDIAEGEGDLTRELDVNTKDEVGVLAESFNRFVARLRDMVCRTRVVAKDLTDATDKIRISSGEVNSGALKQSESLEESHRAILGIEEAVSGIAESTGSLVDSAEESSSATLELGATIEEIASQMEKLFQTVEEVSSSISEMSVASQQISENVEILSSSTEVTASSVTELDASIKEIEENAERTSQLSEEAARDAQAGKDAVDETIEGIGAIRETVDQAARAIEDLGNQSNAIGRILTVIDDVADQTSLLALNAAIIAAQAGEHGKGFAVVADEIRELAERTAVSTKEIAAIINSLQSGTQEAVKAMAAGSERVHKEVERSKSAGAALDKIKASTLKSTEQVRSIVRATQEQSRGSRQITNSINEVASMLGQIATAIRQQNDGNQQLARAAEAMKEIASQGKLSTGEQAKGSRQINASMERIRTMVERIDEATREQTQRCRQVVEAVASIRQIAEGNAGRTAELDQVVDILSRQTDALEEEVGAFKV